MSVLANGWDGVPPAQAGPLGLVVLLLLAGACVFLFRSMSKQLRKVPDTFDPPERPAVDPEQPAVDSPGQPVSTAPDPGDDAPDA